MQNINVVGQLVLEIHTYCLVINTKWRLRGNQIVSEHMCFHIFALSDALNHILQQKLYL